MHLEILSVGAVQPNTGGTGVVFAGDSLTVRNAKGPVDILTGWQTNQVAGFGQLAFPSGHDTTRGFRAGAAIGGNPAFIPLGMSIPVTAQEQLAFTIAGSNVGGDLEQLSVLLRYKDMPGLSMRGITYGQLQSRVEKLTTIESSITSSAGPGYSGEEALNADSDLLLANRDYAVLGMYSRTLAHALTLRGPDLGNVRIGVPGNLDRNTNAGFFPMLARAYGEPLIPVINSGNKSSTLVGVAVDENAGTFVVTTFLALLK